MTDSEIGAELRSLMDWYRALGVRDLIAETPTDWFQLAETAKASRTAPAPPVPAAVRVSPHRPAVDAPAPAATKPRPAVLQAPDDAIISARTLAKGASSLDALRDLLAGFDGCGLKATAKNLCFYRGAAHAPLMLIGEAPGRDEDLQGKPFVGRAGQLLDKMLGAIGSGEANVHITNIVYWRPPGNRTPTPQEAQVCAPFLVRQIELVSPRIILLLGGAAAKQMLDTADGIMRLRGTWRKLTIAGREIPTLATLHPAYLLRTPAHKRLAWRDMLNVQEALVSGG